tara:strand:- start:27105 stop:27287 length:183 start_codon:yes stop_codon:yes gene_type:complete
MTFSLFALASSEWGISRFTTDFFALSALLILGGLPWLLLKNRIQAKSLWSDGNAISNRSN